MRLGLAISAIVMLGSCIDPPLYRCTNQSVCVLDNVQGYCDLSNQQCVYEEPGCPTGYKNGYGTCVDGPDEPDDTSANDTTSTTGEEDEGESSSGSEAGESDTMGGTDEDPCSGGGSADITAMGTVGASTVFKGYAAALAVDGSRATSWFSSGPEGPSQPTRYTWTAELPVCIRSITLQGNDLHSNPEFREGFGFGLVTIRVFDSLSQVVFEEAHDLPGSPDPEVESSLMDVVGTRVVLEFYGHENEDCGGFSELIVRGE